VPSKSTPKERPPSGNKALCEQLGYVFAQPQLLQRALTHRSYAPEHYERLEFLGDSILGCVIAKYLYTAYPKLSEGELSRLRSNLIKEETLAKLARQIDLGSHLKLGEGELKGGGFSRPSILADAMESLIGAVMLDGGFGKAEDVVLGLYIPFLKNSDAQTLGKDAKTLLQEHLQARHIDLPTYSITSTTGAAHAQSFDVECSIPSLDISAHGTGNSRRSAEQQAALAVYQQLSGTS